MILPNKAISYASLYEVAGEKKSAMGNGEMNVSSP